MTYPTGHHHPAPGNTGPVTGYTQVAAPAHDAYGAYSAYGAAADSVDYGDPGVAEALAYLALEVPTRPIRRTVTWSGLAVLLVVVLAGLMITTLVRGSTNGSDSAAGCPDDPAMTGAGGAPAGAPTPEQRANAAIVVSTGRAMGVPDRGLWVGLAVALTESRLRNLPGGDRDSLGLFQQRPSQGWGTAAQIADPAYAATQFFTHLVAVPGWESMPLSQAAQSVQRSAFPDAYNQWASLARTLLTDAGGAAPQPCAPAGPAAPGGPGAPSGPVGGQVGAVLAAARAQLGKPYVWGATGPNSYDCSGLTLTAWRAGGVSLPRTSAAQASAGPHIPLTQLQPGDLLFWSVNGQISGIHHVALSLGGGVVLEAAQTGIPVRTRQVTLPGPGGGGEKELLPFAVRPASSPPNPA